MLAASSFTLLYLAFALLHGAEPSRAPHGFPKPVPPWNTVMRVMAVMIAWANWGLIARAADAMAALLISLTTFTVAGTLCVVLTPLCPRFAWGLAIASVPLSVVLSVSWAHNG